MSPFVARNLDNAQFTQPRGSQYEGPRSSFVEANDSVNEDEKKTQDCGLCGETIYVGMLERHFAKDHNEVCYRHPRTTMDYGICAICDIERDEETESELRALHGDR